MLSHYFEITVTPDRYPELFSDFILDETEQAIEEINGSIIVRTEEEPAALEHKIEQFAKVLSERLDEKIAVKTVSEEKENCDWIQLYKDSVQPIEVAPFYIHPSWCEPKSGFKNIIVDPALAFGSGHHETTYMCLKILARYVKTEQELLDVGCGSGILSLAAAKLGAIPDLCDTDPLAIEESEKNFSTNGLALRSAWVGSASNANQKYDIVLANIVADVLEIISKDLQKCLKPESILILSGILATKKDKILKKYRDLTLIDEMQNNEWVSLVMQKS